MRYILKIINNTSKAILVSIFLFNYYKYLKNDIPGEITQYLQNEALQNYFI